MVLVTHQPREEEARYVEPSSKTVDKASSSPIKAKKQSAKSRSKSTPLQIPSNIELTLKHRRQLEPKDITVNNNRNSGLVKVHSSSNINESNNSNTSNETNGKLFSITWLRRTSPVKPIGGDSNNKSINAVAQQGEALLLGIRDLLMEQWHTEKQVAQGLATHSDRARARFAAANKKGASMSMKKVLALRHSVAQIKAAQVYLQQQEAALSQLLKEYKKQQSQQQQQQTAEKPQGGEDPAASLDVSPYEGYAAKVQEILDEPQDQEQHDLTDEQLLQQLSKDIQSGKI
mmetsp:Transcript_13848/g.30285  ORF Transcript_13848/g.30285 Transcript_13848/m.30285 type:complete len:288 (-) Transcript_13848:139-1002(-)|eukprot:CAMPEP_0168749406 /NCGR_PEP_ID=MMETSP0724-20121128/16699_1 /TAXON_ID=265536 /ORGANISM="Amphiprora sp., Strain CCMP467" /LENGTH=287 /DNA_ID=CAMNT_0008797313 /DNA_START=177 /DNA_END=1040 /DNA_ORIENTATION=+